MKVFSSLNILIGGSLLAAMAIATASASASDRAVAPGGRGETISPTRNACTLEAIRPLLPRTYQENSIRSSEVDKVRAVPGPVAHCEVLGHTITQGPGASTNRVEWSVLLPDAGFARRYYVQGQGGSAGAVLVADSPATQKLLAEGFAFASSDTGHKGSLNYDYGKNNPAALVDGKHRGAHVSHLMTQAIARNYYGMASGDKLFRYHVGCSGGGLMGMVAARNHPEDFDGIVASSGMGRGGILFLPWIMQYVIQHPDSWISPPKLKALETAVNKACAGPDGLIRDPKVCGFRPEALECKAGDSDQCLTRAEIGLAHRIASRYPAGTGARVNGFTMTQPTAWSLLIGFTRPTSMNPDNPWAPAAPAAPYVLTRASMGGIYFPENAAVDMVMDLPFDNPDFLARLDVIHAREGQHPDVGDILPFRRAGGKLMLWAPLAENFSPPWHQMDYYEAVKKLDPMLDDFMRVYEVPGVNHCGGGPGPQDVPDHLLDAVIAWVEQERAPGPLVVTGGTPQTPRGFDGKPLPIPPARSRTVLICPYPKRAVFAAPKGAFPYDASNWRCE